MQAVAVRVLGGELRPPRSQRRGTVDLFAGTLHFNADADVHADHWEVHPAGDAAVCCLRGAMRIYIRSDNADSSDDLVTLREGQTVAVPRARWHRLELDEPTSWSSHAARAAAWNGTPVPNHSTTHAAIAWRCT